MQENVPMLDAVIENIVRKGNPVYKTVYFYGEPDAVIEVLDNLEGAYRAAHPRKRLIRSSGGVFARWAYDAMAHSGRVDPVFLAEDCDFLIFRDIEQLGGKEFCMELIYWVLDYCLEHNIQLVVTGSVPVKDLICLEDRIRAQLAGCLCCSVDAGE